MHETVCYLGFLGYIHQVRSYNRTISVTTLFSPTSFFNSSGCEDLDMGYLPMSEAPIHWTYKEGDRTIDLGYKNLQVIRNNLLEPFNDSPNRRVHLKNFIRFSTGLSDSWQIDEREVFQKYLDINGKGYYTKEDIMNLPIENLKAIARAMEDPAGPLEAAPKIEWEKLLKESLARDEEERRQMMMDSNENERENEDDDELFNDDNDDNDEELFEDDDDEDNAKQEKKKHSHEEL